MKKVLLWIGLAAALIVGGVISGRSDPRAGHTASSEAFSAYEKGNDNLISYQLQGAETNLRQAVSLDPGFAMAHAALAQLLQIRGRDDQSKHEYAVADSLAPLIRGARERLQVQVRLSTSSRSRYFAQADSLLAAGKALAPDDLIFLVVEATRADAEDDPQSAETVWRRVLEVNPNYAEAYNRLGYLYLGKGRYEEAEAAMRRYAFVAPDLANPHDSLGEVLMTVGRYEEAETEFARALAKQPDDFPWSQVNIGRIYLRRGQINKGLQLLADLGQVLHGTGWERNVALIAINALVEHDLKDRLDERTRQFIVNYPNDESAAFLRAMRLIYRGDDAGYRALMDSTTTALRNSPKFRAMPMNQRRFAIASARFEGFAAAARGDHAGAVRHFREVITIGDGEPPHELAFDRYQLAVHLAALGQNQDALAELDKIFAINPRVIEALVLATEINLRLDRRVDALKYLEMLERNLTVADPDFPPVIKARELRTRFQGNTGV